MSTKEINPLSGASWYWLTILLAGAATIAILAISENIVSGPLVYIQSGIGVIFTMVLPGFAFIKMLFPGKVPFKTSSESMDSLERIGLSLGTSLILTPLVGFVLNYTPWGVRLVPVTLSLFALTIVSATVAVFRELKQDKPKQTIEIAFK